MERKSLEILIKEEIEKTFGKLTPQLEARFVKPLLNKQREIDALKFAQVLVEETRATLAKHGSLTPEAMNRYITSIATGFNTTERRVRRILRKAGIVA